MPASTAKLDPKSAREHLQAFRFGDLFVEDLGWNHPDTGRPLVIEHEDVSWRAREISQLSGYRVIEVVPTSGEIPFPNAKTQDGLWKRISPHAVANILISWELSRWWTRR